MQTQNPAPLTASFLETEEGAKLSFLKYCDSKVAGLHSWGVYVLVSRFNGSWAKTGFFPHRYFPHQSSSMW